MHKNRVDMREVPFETYKQRLAENILSATDYDALEDRLFEAEWEVSDAPTYEAKDETMVAILKKSHAEGLAGKNHSMEEVEQLLDQRIYELTHRMDSYGDA